MSPSTPRTARRGWPVAAALIVVAATAGVLVHQTSSSPGPVLRELLPSSHGVSETRGASAPQIGEEGPPSRGDERARDDHAVGAADGVLPGGVTVHDDGYPGVANLDPDLIGAVRVAAGDAAAGGLEFRVTSGWRSPELQEQLLAEAVADYGSAEEAARWVATAGTSAHVSGDAIDLGPPEAAAWLSRNGAGYGLCQIYANEPWHFELRPEAVTDGCPRMYADPTEDPRMQG